MKKGIREVLDYEADFIDNLYDLVKLYHDLGCDIKATVLHVDSEGNTIGVIANGVSLLEMFKDDDEYSENNELKTYTCVSFDVHPENEEEVLIKVM